MPALSNPRHEAFAQAIFKGLGGKTRQERAASTAYLTAYPSCSPGHSAESAAWRLLRRVEPILERVRELQAEQNARLQHKLDLSKERVGRNLDSASQLAKHLDNPAAIVSAELGIAKVFGHITDKAEVTTTQAPPQQTSNDIAIELLKDVGLHEPDDAAKQRALEAYDL